MKHKILLIILLLAASITLIAYDYAGSWSRVEKLDNDRLPQSAKAVVDSIYKQAAKENNAIQRQKALIHKMKYINQIEEDSFTTERDLVLKEIETVPPDIKALLHSMLGEMYWRYYQQSRRIIGERTVLAEPDYSDIGTWDTQMIVKKTIEHYNRSLDLPEKMRYKPITDYVPLILPDFENRDQQPYLYDFLALRAINGMKDSHTGDLKPRLMFHLDERYMIPAAEFAKLEITTPDTLSLRYQALLLFQDITRFHLSDDSPVARQYIDLMRFEFIRSSSESRAINEAYEAIMKKRLDEIVNNPAFAEYSYYLADYYFRKNDPDNHRNYVNAYDICRNAVEKYPDSHFASRCGTIMDEITKKRAQIKLDAINPVNRPAPMTVRYRNLPTIFFRVYEWDQAFSDEHRGFPDDLDIKKHYLPIQPYKSWSIDPPDPGDFLDRTLIAELKPLDAGEYIIFASDNESFESIRDHVRFKVSDIAWFYDSNDEYGMLHVVDRNTGNPLENVKVEVYTYHRYQNQSPIDIRLTDEKGRIHLEPGHYSFVFKNGTDILDIRNTDSANFDRRSDDSRTNRSVRLFTDRKMYRPGQTIYYKGILSERKDDHDVRLITDETIDITLRDPNGKEVSTHTHTTNDFGSFNGSFIAPKDGITGSMTLVTPHGSINVQVEEYKRPKFEITFDPIKEVYRIGSDIVVNGKAESFAGTGIGDAEVTYQVMRNHFYPWGMWRHFSGMHVGYIVASGTVKTTSDGSFAIPFTLMEDETSKGEKSVAYSYSISVDVTDINGETRSDRTMVYAGYRALTLDVNMGEDVDRESQDTFELRTENLMGEHVPVRGEVIVSRLKHPDRIFRWSYPREEPDTVMYSYKKYIELFPHDPYLHEDDRKRWEVDETVYTGEFNSEDQQEIVLREMRKWRPGAYRIEIRAKDPLGEEVVKAREFILYSSEAKKPAVPTPLWVKSAKKAYEPGETAQIIIGTSYKNATIIYAFKDRSGIFIEKTIILDNEQRIIELPITEKHRGGVGFNAVMFRDNRGYDKSIDIRVPWTNKKLDIEWSTFRDKITPGSKETFTLTIKDYKGKAAIAEMLATLYDASLDEFYPNDWNLGFFYEHIPHDYWNVHAGSDEIFMNFESKRGHGYRYSSKNDRLNWFRHRLWWGNDRNTVWEENAMPMRSNVASFHTETATSEMEEINQDKAELAGGGGTIPIQDVQIRKNMAETAFFYPELRTNSKGEIEFTFTVPDALTRWKLLGVAHTEALEAGRTEMFLNTQKPLMITPNLPRFLRDGDRIVLSAKIASIVDEKLDGKAQLLLFNAEDMQPIDSELGNKNSVKTFTVEPRGNTSVNWEIEIPGFYQAVVVRMVAKSGNFSDGEEHLLPVLPNRMLVTESLPLPVRGKQTKDFTFRKLMESGESTSLKHHRLTLEFTTYPVWYVVQALPYMAEYPYECAEQIFTRYYGNELAGYIVKQNPKIERIFQQWRDLPDSKALLSNLEKNQDIKAVLLEETPWVRQAENESDRKKRIGLLFDLNRMSMQREKALEKLFEMRFANGAWPWFFGMYESRYITQYIMEGFAHLKALGVDLTPTIESKLTKSIHWLDDKLNEDYRYLIKNDIDLEKRNIGSMHIHYFYMRSFFPDVPVEESNRTAYDYYFNQLKTYWRDWSLQVEALQALALFRYGETELPRKVVASLRERALHSDEMGMYWKENRIGFYWFEAPVETQSLLIELFREIGTQEEVDELRVWLLKQKQTQDWKTTKATAEACYAMLIGGSDWLSNDRPVEIKLGDHRIKPESKEAGTGYFRESWSSAEIEPEMANVHISNPNDHPAWGALYWQYFEDLDKITPHETPLALKKQLFIERRDDNGTKLHPITESDPIEVGDRVIVRVELRVDREMEYVHMKDMRAAGFEPENVLSTSKWQQGLWYYESTRDASTNFFIERLHKGTFVFEYPLRAFQAGTFSAGITTIQCMYAPDFTSHSEGIRVVVED